MEKRELIVLFFVNIFHYCLCQVHIYEDPQFDFRDDLLMSTPETHNSQVACVLKSWMLGTYRGDAGFFHVEDIDPTLCTNIVFRGGIYSSDPENINHQRQTIITFEGEANAEDFKYQLKHLFNLKDVNPNLKVTYAVQLGRFKLGNNNDTFHNILSSLTVRRKLAMNILDTLKLHGFDGVWIIPTEHYEGRAKTGTYLTEFIKDFFYLLEVNGLYLGLVVPLDQSIFKKCYNIQKLERYVHSFILAGQVPESYKAVHRTPLHGETSVESVLTYLINQKISPYKIILGILTFYSPVEIEEPIKIGNGLGEKILATNFSHNLKKERQNFDFLTVCAAMQNDSNMWNIFTDERVRASFLSGQNGLWSSIEDIRSVQAKIEFGMQRSLGGYAVWHVSGDDFNGSICGSGVTFPLLRSINFVLNTYNYTANYAQFLEHSFPMTLLSFVIWAVLC